MRKTYGILVLVLTGLLCNYALIAGEAGTETTTQAGGRSSNPDYQQKLIDGKLESFENRVDGLQWTITTVLTSMGIILAVLGLFVFKQGKEYKEAVARAEKEADKAKASAKNAKEWEEKARDRFDSINPKVEELLKEIEEKGNKKIENLIKEADIQRMESQKQANKQRSLTEMETEASTAYNMRDYKAAAENYQQIHEMYGLERRPLFNMLGSSFLNWAGTIEKGVKQIQLANEAIKNYLKAEGFTEGTAAYNIACCYAILDEPEKCKEWLNTAKRTDKLISLERAKTDRDLKKYAKEGWFKQIWGQ